MAALAPWKSPQWLEWGVALDMFCARKVVSSDESNTGWGAMCEGKPTLGPWLKEKSQLHIKCLEMLALCRALLTFLPDLKGHHVLVHPDSMTVVFYINRQGRLTSKHLFEWAHLNLHLLRAMHVSGILHFRRLYEVFLGTIILGWADLGEFGPLCILRGLPC